MKRSANDWKKKYHPLVTDDVIWEAGQYFGPEVSDDEIAELMTGVFQMFEDWSKPEAE